MPCTLNQYKSQRIPCSIVYLLLTLIECRITLRLNPMYTLFFLYSCHFFSFLLDLNIMEYSRSSLQLRPTVGANGNLIN